MDTNRTYLIKISICILFLEVIAFQFKIAPNLPQKYHLNQGKGRKLAVLQNQTDKQ